MGAFFYGSPLTHIDPVTVRPKSHADSSVLTFLLDLCRLLWSLTSDGTASGAASDPILLSQKPLPLLGFETYTKTVGDCLLPRAKSGPDAP